MSAIFESRLSDSPYIEIIWRGHVERDYQPVCPADVGWNLLFVKNRAKIHVSVEGPTSQHVPKVNFEGSEFLVIKFKLGVYMPSLAPDHIVNKDVKLPEANSNSFWLNGFSWELPNFENAECIVERLVREDVLHIDDIVTETLQAKQIAVSPRTVRRRFLRATGLAQETIHQIERAHVAANLLEKGMPILDTVYEAGYSDQPHMNRSLKRFYGYTPTQIAKVNTDS